LLPARFFPDIFPFEACFFALVINVLLEVRLRILIDLDHLSKSSPISIALPQAKHENEKHLAHRNAIIGAFAQTERRF
jgi:hypothetical protein